MPSLTPASLCSSPSTSHNTSSSHTVSRELLLAALALSGGANPDVRDRRDVGDVVRIDCEVVGEQEREGVEEGETLL